MESFLILEPTMTNPEQSLNDNHQLLDQVVKARWVLDRRDSPVLRTEIIRDKELSTEFEANIFFASELGQISGSFKTRGAENYISNRTYEEQLGGFVVATAGNHGGGIALSVRQAMERLQRSIPLHEFMPKDTPLAKIDKIVELSSSDVNIELVGRNFDSSQKKAIAYAKKTGAMFISPYDDMDVMAGQGTWAAEICEEVDDIGVILCPVGGMGLIAATSVVVKNKYPKSMIIGVEPEGAASLLYARQRGKPSRLKRRLDTYVDGAAVRQVGDLPFEVANHLIDLVLTVPNLELRQAVTQLWERPSRPLRAELAGGLALAGLKRSKDLVKGKNVVVMVSGGNLSQERYEREVRV